MEITIAQINIRNSRLIFDLKYSKGLRKYFLKDSFYVEYDKSIELGKVDPSILSVPLISAIIPVAWALGADIVAPSLDKAFLDGLRIVEEVFKVNHPNFSFAGSINTKKVVDNRGSGNRTGLLFSGGLDSTTSYLKHRDQKPDLIPVWGADISVREKKFWNKVMAGIDEFAAIDNVAVSAIKTDLREINEQMLTMQFRVTWNAAVSHGLMLLGLCAPVTAARNIGTIIISSSHTQNFKAAWGSDPRIDGNVKWAGVRVIHDSYDMTRQDKIEYISRNYPEFLTRIRSCYSSGNSINCGRCEKCSRTIVGLALAGKDPRKEGQFNVDNKTFGDIKNCLNKGRYELRDNGKWMWRDIQQHIPARIETDFYGSKEFLAWLKTFDFLKYRMKKPQYFWWTMQIYFKNGNIARPARSIGRYLLYYFSNKLRFR